MTETGFYLLGTSGYDATRALAVARHVGDAVAYIYRNSVLAEACDAHGIPTVEIRCATPNCTGPSSLEIREWMVDRQPERLVMDTWPYGPQAELFEVVAARRQPTFLLQRATGFPNEFIRSHFAERFTADGQAPFVSVSLQNLPSRGEARARLGGGDRPLVVLVGEALPKVNRYVLDRCADVGVDVIVLTKWPMTGLLIGADLVVGPASHLSLEARALGVEMASFPSTRDQRHLVDTNAVELSSRIAALEVREPWTISYADTAADAAGTIGGG